MYTYTHEIKGGKTVCLARFLSCVSYFSCVVLNASQQITVTCLYSIQTIQVELFAL